MKELLAIIKAIKRWHRCTLIGRPSRQDPTVSSDHSCWRFILSDIDVLMIKLAIGIFTSSRIMIYELLKINHIPGKQNNL